MDEHVNVFIKSFLFNLKNSIILFKRKKKKKSWHLIPFSEVVCDFCWWFVAGRTGTGRFSYGRLKAQMKVQS